MTPGHTPRVLSIPPGLPFLKTLAASLCDGTLTPFYTHDPDDPLSLARVTIYVPTRRAARALRSEFVDLLGGRSAILPVIRPLGETDDDSGYFDADLPATVDLAQPISGPSRLLELARLVLAWRNTLPQVVRDIHSDSPLVAPASPADAVWLARDLAELIDAIETEERDWSDLDKLSAGDHALWWQLTLAFLKIASSFWPERLAELGNSSPARHKNAILYAEAQRLSGLSGSDPVIVAGSTGSIPAAADLIVAVARLPQGIVVLPGLDLAMPAQDWDMVAPETMAGTRSDPATRTHPQYGLHQLLKRLHLTRKDIDALAEPAPDLALRASAISRAMAPADATDRWSEWQATVDHTALKQAFADVCLIEASNEREEATAIAIALKLALEQPVNKTDHPSQAALITPDRALARRVAAELARFGIEADDSAGTPLSATPQGTLLQLILEATLRPGDPVVIVALLKHPLVRFGMDIQSLRDAADILELYALRGGVAEVDITELAPLLERQINAQESDRHRPHWRPVLSGEAVTQAKVLAATIATALEPLASALVRVSPNGRGMTTAFTLSQWAERSGRVLEAVCRDTRGDLASLWSGEAGATLADLLKSIMETDGQMEADGPQWIDIMAAFATGEAVKPRSMSHPRVFIFGTLEARLQSVDTMILGGLNEGSWPDQTANNPFISRTMKTDMGLEPPERRIGQLAHDFEMANGTRRLIYSRALRQGSTPTVASRWLQRLMALGGKAFGDDLRARGLCYRQWSALLDQGDHQPSARRPDPRPPKDLQPTKYSFSEVGRLRRDPYSIYARRVLKLDPIDDFNRDPGASERGTLYHRIIDTFTKQAHIAGTPAAREAMSRILNDAFDDAGLPAHIDAVWRPRFAEVASAFLAWEAQRHQEIRRSFTEVPADKEIEALGIRLTGVADRIDIKTSGLADIIDYKTGFAPTVSQARVLLDPQLALEAAALRDGAFRSVGPQEADRLLYVRLRPGDRFRAEPVNNEASRSNPKSAMDLATEAMEQLTKFVTLLQNGDKGFVSRLVPAKEQDYGGEYDHLARVAEWSTAEAEESGNDE